MRALSPALISLNPVRATPSGRLAGALRRPGKPSSADPAEPVRMHRSAATAYRDAPGIAILR